MKAKILDAIGASAAALCLVHCLVFPFLMILPFGLTHNPIIDICFLFIGSVVVYKITTKRISKWLKLLFWGSIFLIFVSIIIDIIFHVHTPLIYFGAVGLISGHVINYKEHKH